jgi:hypothetical protein
MLVDIGPAKRIGTRKNILDRPLVQADVTFVRDETVLTFCADGVHGVGALYRYELHLTRADIELLQDADQNNK